MCLPQLKERHEKGCDKDQNNYMFSNFSCDKKIQQKEKIHPNNNVKNKYLQRNRHW